MEFLRRLCCCRPKPPRKVPLTYRMISSQLYEYEARIRIRECKKPCNLIYRRAKSDIARPYSSEPAESADEESADEDPAVQVEGFMTQEGRRITTRARYTYGLERYEKNAMLIFAQTEPQGPELIEQRVGLLTRSFQQFGFEVEGHLDLGPEEMEAQLESFFSKDFSRVGAVCVAVVGGMGEAEQLPAGPLPAGPLRCHESRVLGRLTASLPAALEGRPRVYITELARTSTASESGVYSLPITGQFPDVLAIHVPVVIEGEMNPLQMLCARLGTQRDLKAEVMAAAHEAETTFPALAERPIQIDSTLTLELELVRADEPSVLGNILPNDETSAEVGEVDGVSNQGP